MTNLTPRKFLAVEQSIHRLTLYLLMFLHPQITQEWFYIMPDSPNEQLNVFFQPIIDTESETVIGAEALLRVNAEGIEIDTLPFLAQAQSDDSIWAIDHWVLKESLTTLRRWRDDDLIAIQLYINVAETTIASPEFPDVVTALLEEYSLPPSVLVLEINIGCYYNIACVSNLTELQNAGVQVAVDNVGGTGTKANPFPNEKYDIYKLDKKLFADNDCKDALRENVENFRHDDRCAVAVGVENTDHMQWCEELDIKFYQGFFAAKALPAKEFESNFLTYDAF